MNNVTWSDLFAFVSIIIDVLTLIAIRNRDK